MTATEIAKQVGVSEDFVWDTILVDKSDASKPTAKKRDEERSLIAPTDKITEDDVSEIMRLHRHRSSDSD